MGDALAEGLGVAHQFGIHVVGEEIPAVACMGDDVGLGDRPAKALAGLSLHP